MSRYRDLPTPDHDRRADEKQMSRNIAGDRDQRAYEGLVADVGAQINVEAGLAQIASRTAGDRDQQAYQGLVADVGAQINVEAGLAQIAKLAPQTELSAAQPVEHRAGYQPAYESTHRVVAEPDHIAQLVEAALRGERQAWNGLVDRFLPLVRSVTSSYRLSGGDAENVSQTVWLRLVEHLKDIREPRALPKWIIKMTRHESLRVIKARRRPIPVDPLSDPAFDAEVDPGEVDSDLLRAERHQALRDGLLLLLVADPPLSSERLL